MADLAKVNPQIEGTRAVVSASITCRSVLKGEREQVQVVTTQERFSRSAERPISEAEAMRIIEIIKTNGFCVKA